MGLFMKKYILKLTLFSILSMAQFALANQGGVYLVGCKAPKEGYPPGWYDANWRSVPHFDIGSLDKRSDTMGGRILGAKAIFGGVLTDDEVYINIPSAESSGGTINFLIYSHNESVKIGTLYLSRADAETYSGRFIAEKNIVQSQGSGQFSVTGCLITYDKSETGGYRPDDL